MIYISDFPWLRTRVFLIPGGTSKEALKAYNDTYTIDGDYYYYLHEIGEQSSYYRWNIDSGWLEESRLSLFGTDNTIYIQKINYSSNLSINFLDLIFPSLLILTLVKLRKRI